MDAHTTTATTESGGGKKLVTQLDYARAGIVTDAMRAVDVVPQVKPVRGGTDGAQLSFKGLPCPNIFAGGLNFHGRYEFVPIQSMEKATEVIVQIARMAAEK